MLFVIHCIDAPGSQQARKKAHEAHQAYLKTATVRPVLAGPLVSDDGDTMTGSFLLVEADSRDEVESFNRADPFNLAKVWQTINISRIDKRWDDRG